MTQITPMARRAASGASRPAAALRALGCGVLDAVLPQTCVACDRWIPAGGEPICDTCREEIDTALRRPACPRCGRTLPTAAIHEDACARCRTEHFWNVAGVLRIGTYTPALRSLVLGLKYEGRQRNAEFLADLLAAALRACDWGCRLDALVPVPMHWLRRAQRPADHARVLTEALARRLKSPVVRLVRRARHAPSQVGIRSKTQRLENVKGCFALPWWSSASPPGWWLPAPWWPAGASRLFSSLLRRRSDLRGKTVCIVDNLLATGATVCEVSKVLRRAGAKHIYAAVVARPAAPGDPASGLPDMDTTDDEVV
jgi:predicted amidophosphoribosyltransferase